MPFASDPPLLPILLWNTPPAVELILRQEGIPAKRVTASNSLAFEAGRFVLFDSRAGSRSDLRALLGPVHSALDVNDLRPGRLADPWAALIESRAAEATWSIGGHELTERVCREPKARLRRELLNRIRSWVDDRGGVWARIAAFPHPYRSAFNLRIDLDEPAADDYFRFARARKSIDDCTTHFVNTRAYGDLPRVLADLRGRDAQSHAHHHVVYRDDDLNRRNVERADALLRGAGFDPTGFAGPEGRWTPGLDQALEDLEYSYSSDFQIGYDDLPFFPWRGDRFSRVLQVPIHPVCEGLFQNAGARDGQAAADHLCQVVESKIASGEPAFVYGHPERRLGRQPEIVSAVANAVSHADLVWRVTLTEFARWWRWRDARTWSLIDRGGGRIELQLDEWDETFPIALEVVRGEHVSRLNVIEAQTVFRPSELVYERDRQRDDDALPRPVRRRRRLRKLLREALDWETVTPLDELPEHTVRARFKKRLRRWRDRSPSDREETRCA